MPARARSSACDGGELPAHVHPIADPQPRRQPFQRDPLGTVADDLIAQRGVSRPEHRQRAQHVGVALARDQMAHCHERRWGALAPGGARRVEQIGA